MNRLGSPVGILLIGVGVVVLALGWTGRFNDVVAAIKGGTGENPVDAGSDIGAKIHKKIVDDVINAPENPSKPAPTRCVILDAHQDVKTMVLEDEMASPDGDPNVNGGCRPGYLSGMQCADGLHVCVKSVRGAGAAENAGYGNLSIVPLPTGFFGARYQPNV
jgi:hypothetical protein